jgi:malate dehydrogenase (oxaloacetate-decarboxylating)
MLGLLAGVIGDAGGIVGAIDLVEVDGASSVRDIVVDGSGREHWERIVAAIESLPGAEVIDTTDRTFLLHVGGKIEQHNKHPLKTRDDLSMAYTPGVARVSLAIAEDEEKAFQYTIKRNTVAVVSDGSAVLGLGDIGPRAAMPVMEGKCCLFKEFAGVDAFPICLDTTDTEEIVRAVELIAPGFGGINLEDISAPRCFEIEERLKRGLDIPVFHDDQHGTAVVVMAALLNAVKLTDRRLEDLRVLIIGLGAAGIAVTKILLAAGVRHIVGADSQGALHTNREDYLDGSMNAVKRWFAQETNPDCRSGTPEEVIDGEDLLIGVSGARALPAKALARMNEDAMVFAMANPNPEIHPEEAAPYVRIIATGRSDYPNQINNVLCFPGIFRGALDVRARTITEEMKMTAAYAIAQIVDESELREDYIIPSVFNRDVAPAVAAAVAEEARAAGTARAGQEVGFAQGDTMTGSSTSTQ